MKNKHFSNEEKVMKARRNISIIIAIVLSISLTSNTTASLMSVKLTSDSLGLGNSDINTGKTVDPDVPGLFTSPTVGQGSILQIQTDSLAGSGTESNPLLVTITTQTHLDTLYGLPAINDYQAGVIVLNNESPDLPDGKKEGLGVRAFTVDEVTAARVFDPVLGLAKIEGSKHVSGGTGPDTFGLGGVNGAPHVDESVNFEFNELFDVSAQSVEVLLSDFEWDVNKDDKHDKIDLRIVLASDEVIELESIGPFGNGSDIFEAVGEFSTDKLWKVMFSAIDELDAEDLVKSFRITAVDDYPQAPRETAEHFFITGFNVDASVNEVPEPTTIALFGFGSMILIKRSKSRKNRN